MILDRVTITGADDSIDPKDLIPITQRFPFVEWAILLSKSQEGKHRFPSKYWMFSFRDTIHDNKDIKDVKISGHLCGRWVRDVCEGNWNFCNEHPIANICHIFNRIQLNFHAHVHSLDRDKFLMGLQHLAEKYEFIFQIDDVNNSIFDDAKAALISANPLFDLSGGAGILPASWPKPTSEYCGYAGGLSPENIAQQLEIISKVVGEKQRIWIDTETRVRSADDSKLDLDKVVKFLEASEPFVTK